MNKVTAIVVAAGRGSRMKSEKKKQFMELNGKPIIWYTLLAFEKSRADNIVLVTGHDDMDYCEKEIVNKYDFSKVTSIVCGGDERYQSVYNGLQNAEGEIILIHDGARPLVSNDIIERCIVGAEQYGACTAGMPVKDTIKMVNSDGLIECTPDRNRLWLTQTPQAFSKNVISEAYAAMMKHGIDNITDDSMVVEKFSDRQVRFVEGSYNNIKITTPEDITLAATLLAQQNPCMKA